MAIAQIQSPLTVFEPAYAQRALLAVLALAVLAAVLGGSIVLRDLPFFTHAIGVGAYPVLVVAVIVGLSISIGAIAGALLFGAIVSLISARASSSGWRDAATGVTIAAALATGAVIAATAGSANTALGRPAESLLFGSVLFVSSTDLVTIAVVAVVSALAWSSLREHWLASGFDPSVARQLGAERGDAALIICVALATGATLPLTGSLLAGALLIVPAATARVLCRRHVQIAPATFAIAVGSGAIGLYVAIVADLPAGAAIALVSVAGFLLAASVTAIRGWHLARRRRLRAPAVLATLLTTVVIGGCGDSNDAGEQRTDKSNVAVVATTPQVASIARGVGGDAASIQTLVPAGSDLHSYEPRPSDLAKLADAEVILRSGGDADEWVIEAAKLAGAKVTPVDLSHAVELLPAGEGGHGSEHEDEHESDANPHWFLAPQNVVGAARHTRDEFVKAAPLARESFRANTDSYIERIEQVESSARKCANQLSASQLTFVSDHDEFDYLADAFELTIAAQISPNGHVKPSAKQLQQAVDAAKKSNARAVATGRGESSRLSSRVAEQLNVPRVELYADSLAESGEASELTGAIAFDVDRLVAAMSGGKVDCGLVP